LTFSTAPGQTTKSSNVQKYKLSGRGGCWEDMTRDKYLEALGFTVLRFENRFVFQEPDIVLDEIRKVFRKRLSSSK